ncbi:hypothetical protein KAR91_07915 [Candidatus Pacearchaeota archaeon]|nr:hypothetical protein [Candidatus Pacearchaeota archaeon]
MNSELTEIIIPSIAFFVGFLLTFTLLELLIILMLNGFVLKHWSFVVDVVIKARVQHGKLIQRITLASVAVFLTLLFYYTNVLTIIRESSPEEQLYVAEILLVVLFTYIRSTRYVVELTFLKSIHKYLYIYLSSLIAVVMILVVHAQYENYQKLINATLIAPVEAQTKIVMENYKRKHLLNEFRRQIHNNTCEYVDYTFDLKEGNTKHFLYVTTDPELSTSNVTHSGDDTTNYTTGHACTKDGETFLLTEYGLWFWVIDTGEPEELSGEADLVIEDTP